MKAPYLDPSALFNAIGRTLIAVQSFDYSLCHYIVIWTHTSQADAEKLLVSSLQKTLGQLLKALDKASLTPKGLECRLEEYRGNRNWFIHHLYAHNWNDLYHNENAKCLAERIAAVHSEAKQLTELFSSLNEKWCLENGSTPEELQTFIDERLNEVMNHQQTR